MTNLTHLRWIILSVILQLNTKADNLCFCLRERSQGQFLGGLASMASSKILPMIQGQNNSDQSQEPSPEEEARKAAILEQERLEKERKEFIDNLPPGPVVDFDKTRKIFEKNEKLNKEMLSLGNKVNSIMTKMNILKSQGSFDDSSVREGVGSKNDQAELLPQPEEAPIVILQVPPLTPKEESAVESATMCLLNTLDRDHALSEEQHKAETEGMGLIVSTTLPEAEEEITETNEKMDSLRTRIQELQSQRKVAHREESLSQKKIDKIKEKFVSIDLSNARSEYDVLSKKKAQLDEIKASLIKSEAMADKEAAENSMEKSESGMEETNGSGDNNPQQQLETTEDVQGEEGGEISEEGGAMEEEEAMESE